MSATVSERPTGEQPALRGDHPYPGDAPSFSEAAVRTPGRHMSPRLAGHVPAAPAADPALLREVVKSLKGIPGDDEPVYAAVRSERLGTGPAPAPAPFKAGSVAGWAEGTVRGLLVSALWDAVRWYGDMSAVGCGDCEAAGAPCRWHAEKYDRYFEYSRLHDLAMEAASDAAAMEAVTCSVRAGKADAADLASPGSHLDLILSGALSANGGAA